MITLTKETFLYAILSQFLAYLIIFITVYLINILIPTLSMNVLTMTAVSAVLWFARFTLSGLAIYTAQFILSQHENSQD